MSWFLSQNIRIADELAPKSFFLSPAPMLLLSNKGLILEINLALRELAKTDINACKGQNFAYLMERLESKLVGPLISEASILNNSLPSTDHRKAKPILDNLGKLWTTCRYNTPEYGAANLRAVETPLLETLTGDIQGILLSLEILDLEHHSHYSDALRKRIQHELMWEIYAASYDRVLPQLDFYQEVLKRHISAMNSATIMDVLDIGAGTGNVSIELLKANKNITAVDTSLAMLKQFYLKIDETMAKNLTIIEDTAERLPHLSSNSFDGVTVLLAFFDMLNPFAALEEALRLLKPGGTLIVTEPKACFNVTELMAYAEDYLHKQDLMNRLEEDWHRIQTVAPHINKKIQEVQSSDTTSLQPWHAETLHKILTERGFVDLSFEESHRRNCATIKGIKP